jgi:hypothetical protein
MSHDPIMTRSERVDRRADELIEEQLKLVGEEQLLRKMDTVYETLLREFRLPRSTILWDDVLIKIARRVGVLGTVAATPEAVFAASERPPKPRWAMLAAMVYGEDFRRGIDRVRELYTLGSGRNANERWTGRGTHPSGYRH